MLMAYYKLYKWTNNSFAQLNKRAWTNNPIPVRPTNQPKDIFLWHAVVVWLKQVSARRPLIIYTPHKYIIIVQTQVEKENANAIKYN